MSGIEPDSGAWLCGGMMLILHVMSTPSTPVTRSKPRLTCCGRWGWRGKMSDYDRYGEYNKLSSEPCKHNDSKVIDSFYSHGSIWIMKCNICGKLYKKFLENGRRSCLGD